jgi:hypothetical protein
MHDQHDAPFCTLSNPELWQCACIRRSELLLNKSHSNYIISSIHMFYLGMISMMHRFARSQNPELWQCACIRRSEFILILGAARAILRIIIESRLSIWRYELEFYL